MDSTDVATAAPVDVLLLPVAPMEDCAAVRTALFAAELVLVVDDEAVEIPVSTVPLAVIPIVFAPRTLALVVGKVAVFTAEIAVEDKFCREAGVMAAGPVRAFGAVTDPEPSAVVAEPLACAPEVLTQISFSIEGRCRYCGATSITT
jgi:hypothetical protein